MPTPHARHESFVTLPASVLTDWAGVVAFDDADAPPQKFPPKKGKAPPQGPAQGPANGPAKGQVPGQPPGKPAPFRVQIKKHNDLVAKNQKALGGDVPGHGVGEVSANEKSLRDTHKKMGDHLAKRAMAGQWGPAEDGLQRMHDHLSNVLSQHDAHHQQKHAEAEQLASAEEQQQAEADAAEQAANMPPPEPDVRPAEKLAMERRAKKKLKKQKKKARLEKLMAGKEKDRPDLAGLPPSVRAGLASKSGEAPAPQAEGHEDDEDDDHGDGDGHADKDAKGVPGKGVPGKGVPGKGVPGKDPQAVPGDANGGGKPAPGNPFAKKPGGPPGPAGSKPGFPPKGGKPGDEGDEKGDEKGDGKAPPFGEDPDGQSGPDKPDPTRPADHKDGPTPSTEEQANSVLRYKVREHIPMGGPYGLTTLTNAGVPFRKLTRKVRKAADPSRLKNVADRGGGGTRAAVVKKVSKVLRRPLTSGEADIVDPARPGVLSVRPDGGLVKETRAGVWTTPDRFAPPEFVPRASGLMPGAYSACDALGPAVPGAETGSGAARPGSPGDSSGTGLAPDHGVSVGVVKAGGQKLFVPLGPDHRPLCHQHFTDKRTASLAGTATVTGAARTKLHFDRARREWALLRLNPTRGWVETRRFKESEEARAEHHLRRALHEDLQGANVDAGVPGESVPASPHGVGATRLGGDTLYHAAAPDGTPVGELYQDRRTADLAAKALSKGVADTRLRHDGQKWVIETAKGDGWKQAKSFPDEQGLRAEKHFRKRLAKDIERDDSGESAGGEDDNKELGSAELDDTFNKGYKRANRAKRSLGDGSDVSPALGRHASGVVQAAFNKLRSRFGDKAARAVVASGFAQETHGAGLGRKKVGFSVAGFASELDPSGRWITVGHQHVHTDKGGTPDAGGPPEVRKFLGDSPKKGKPGTPDAPLKSGPPTDPSLPPAKGKGGARGDSPAKKSNWGGLLAGLGAGAGLAAAHHARQKKDFREGPVVRHPSDRGGGGRGGERGGGRGGRGGRAGKSGKSIVASSGAGVFNKAALVGIVDFLKQVQAGGVDTTGHGNPATNLGFSAAPAGDPAGAVTFGLPGRTRVRLSRRHVEALGRIFMEEVRGAMRRASLTRQDLHTSQKHHDDSRASSDAKDRAAFSAAGDGLADRVRQAEGSVAEPEARKIVAKLTAVLPAQLLRESRVKDLEIFADSAGTQKRADATQREGVQGVKGFFDRATGLMVTSVVGADAHNFYHELAHSLDHLLTDEDWDGIAAEWGGTRPENFAQAFTDLCLALRAGKGAVRQFAKSRPAVCGVAARHGLSVAKFHTDGTRVARALASARSLVTDLAGLVAGPVLDYAKARAAAAVRVADAVAEFTAATAPALPPGEAARAAAAFASACAELTDALDDVIHSSAAGTPQAHFAEEYAARSLAVLAAALGLAACSAGRLPPAARAREQLAAVVFGWQDQVRDFHGRWYESRSGDAGAAARRPPDPVRDLITAQPDAARLPPRGSVPAVPVPQGGDPLSVARWSAEVASHPYVSEATRLVRQAVAAGATTGNLYWDPDAAGGRGDFTAERKKLHEDIAAHVLNPDAAARPGERPQVAFVLGPPSSGKTSMGRPAARAAMGLPADRVTTLDPDDVKMSLPEYRGWNAPLLHDESAEVFDRLLERAVAGRHHVVFDTTGRSEEFMRSMLDKFAKAGYDAHLVLTHLPGPESAARAVNRFVAHAFDNSPDPEKRGRYVPPSFIALHIDGRPQRVYDALRADPRVRSWVSYDAADLKAGRILNSGTRPAPTATAVQAA